MRFAVGVRTIPAGSLQFVDFSKPDPAADRVERFMTAAQHALAEGDAALAAQRLVYARDAEPDNPAVLRLLTAAFWQAGNLPAAGRTVRDWARVETDRPTPERYASRIYEDMGAFDLAADAAERAADRAPADASAWERLGRLRLRLMDRAGGDRARSSARGWSARRSRACSTWRSPTTWPATSAPRSRPPQAATQIDPESTRAWSTYAHALARTDRLGECEQACRRALALGADAEVSDLLARVEAAAPRGLSERSAAGLRATRPSPRARTPGRTHRAPAARPPHAGHCSTCSSTPSSSPTRQTSRRSSSTSTQAPAEAGKTTWSPGLTGIWTPT